MNVLIIEDERLAAEKLIDLINQYDQSINVVGHLKSVEASINWLRINDHPDLIFSDIELLDGKCFEIFEQVKISRPIIFTTAYDQYAIKAFESNGISYLLKPVNSEKLAASFKKIDLLKPSSESVINLDTLSQLLKPETKTYKRRFLIKVGQKIRSIPTADIAYFFTQDKLSYLMTRTNQRYPLDQPLDELENIVNPDDFFRINRRYLAKIEAIAEIHPYFKGRVKVRLSPEIDDEIVVSSDKTPHFKSWLDE